MAGPIPAIPAASSYTQRQEWLEILEAAVLAAVAVLTAWSGYQAARWGAESAKSYALAASSNTDAQEQLTLAGQDHLYDVVTFDSWMQAWHTGKKDLAGVFERRFRPEFAAAWHVWLEADPFHDPKAAPGPSFLPAYRSAHRENARELARGARAHYDRGVASRETGDEYVRLTVVLATVLLLTALAQRFKIRPARIGLITLAVMLLGLAVFWIASFPRA
jgi:hypothetical protein